jgi:hypothetical protein
MYTLNEDFIVGGVTFRKGVSFKKNFVVDGEFLVMRSFKVPLSILTETEEIIYKKVKKPRQKEEIVVQSNSARISDRKDLLR